MATGITRRDMVRRGGLLTLSGLLPGARGTAAPGTHGAGAQGSAAGADLLESIGVRPVVNARGTYTILGGSLLLPEVRAAMDVASRHYVQLDELAEAVGARLAQLTGAEWGTVTTGCAAALTLATAACVAGGNPDLHVRIPDLRGFPRDECVIPRHSRTVYDASVRAVGVRMVEVETAAELEAALGPRTALVYVLAAPTARQGALTTKVLCEAARARGVPLLVDAAAEILTKPNVHLEAGADLVAYSGGKCLRGPQAAGLLLGRQDLVRAAWVASAPHHGFARGMKVGKEEALGMLAAVEMWFRRDHEAEWRQWESWLDHIARRVSAIAGVNTHVSQPDDLVECASPCGLSNRMPSLHIRWDVERLSLTGGEAVRLLFETEPRVAVHPARGPRAANETGLTIDPYMMSPGDERVVADRIHALLSAPPGVKTPPPAPPVADLSGAWDVRIRFAASSSTHALNLRQHGAELEGTHRGDFVTRDARGTIDGSRVSIRSHYPERHGDELEFTFTGTVSGDEMGGEASLGEYLKARWTATRHAGGRS